MTNLKYYFIFIISILICAILIINEFLSYGLIVLVFGWGVNYVVKKILYRIEQSENNNQQLINELEEIKDSRLNVLGVKEILDIGLLEVNTKLTRVWNQNIEKNDRTLNFIGALDINLIAKFGLDLNKVKIKDGVDDKIFISNTKPHLISFKDIEYTWKISELLEHKQPWLGTNHWRKSDDLLEYCNQIKDQYQKDVHKQIKNGPEELNWIIKPLHNKIKKILSIKYGNDKKIYFTEDSHNPTHEKLN